MAEITAALVKSLRETSGAGMLDCKKALVETNGNMEEAIDWLRKKGLASAAKKASRIAAEGLVSVYVEGNAGYQTFCGDTAGFFGSGRSGIRICRRQCRCGC